ncbi:MAG: hypothetical protein GVY28_07555 [Alphaproteobacteria bacterium]|jgi:hypothetical protein|nr:hypothetical protein [Alphaproteobacteria bacterium]
MRTIVACTLGLMLLAVVGCSDKITAQDIRHDMPGDLHTPAETREQYNNRTALTATVNLRKFNQDVMRLLLLDRPTRGLSYPTALE